MNLPDFRKPQEDTFLSPSPAPCAQDGESLNPRSPSHLRDLWIGPGKGLQEFINLCCHLILCHRKSQPWEGRDFLGCRCFAVSTLRPAHQGHYTVPAVSLGPRLGRARLTLVVSNLGGSFGHF